MAPGLEQVPGHLSHRPSPDSLVVQGGVDEQVEAGVTVLGLVFLPVLDHAAHLAVDQDGQAGRLGLVPGEVFFGLVPPADDLRPLVDPAQVADVVFAQRSEDHLPGVELFRVGTARASLFFPLPTGQIVIHD